MKHHCKILLTIITLVIAAGAAAGAVSPNAKWRNSFKPKGSPAQAVTLASGGRTDYVILIPSAPTSQEEKAAADLALWLKEMTGAEFAIVKDAGSSKFISIGRTSVATAARLGDSDLGKEGYKIAVKADNLYLLGGSIRGPIYAVYALLEEDLGCRWYARDTAATIPHIPDLTFRPVPRKFVPVLERRDPFYWDAFDGTWSLRNRTNAVNAVVPEEWGGWFDTLLFIHSFAALCPPDVYFKDHPEYFSENDGKRNPGQLCVSNPDIVPIVADKVKSLLRESPHSEQITVSQNDWHPCCACAKCMAIADAEGSLSGPLLMFVNAVADAVAEEFPDVKVSTLAYLDTYVPPKTVKPRPNVAIQLCTDVHAWKTPFLKFTETEEFQTAMKGWAAIGANIYIWDYTLNTHHFLAPLPNMQVVTENTRFLFNHNAKGIMLQSAYLSPGSADGPMKSWVCAKLLWDPSLDTRPLIRDFTYGYYGAAAEPMQRYQDILWEMETSRKDILAKASIEYPMDLPIYDRAFLDSAEALFSQSKELAGNDKETLRRVETAELAIIYVELSQIYNRITKNDDRSELARYRDLLNQFETVVNRENVTSLREGGLCDPKEWIAKMKSAMVAPDEARHWTAPTERGEVTIMRLPAQWKFAVDAKNAGVNECWFAESWSDKSWGRCRTDIGTGWDSQGFPKGDSIYGWYRQKIKLPAVFDKKHCYLYFGAVDEDAYVYINGKLTFEHTCQSTGMSPNEIWMTPFIFDARSELKPGSENTLAVRVYSRGGAAGIWKPVYIIASDAEIDLTSAKSAAVGEPKD